MMISASLNSASRFARVFEVIPINDLLSSLKRLGLSSRSLMISRDQWSLKTERYRSMGQLDIAVWAVAARSRDGSVRADIVSAWKLPDLITFSGIPGLQETP